MGFSAETRRTILERDQDCLVSRLIGGQCGGTLHCHHIWPVWQRPDLADDPENGVLVCARHHPTLESIRRILERRERRACRHRHRSREARELCERRLNRQAA